MHSYQSLVVSPAALARPHRRRRYRGRRHAAITTLAVLAACGGGGSASGDSPTSLSRAIAPTTTVASGAASSSLVAAVGEPTSPVGTMVAAGAVVPEGFGTVAAQVTKPDGSVCDLCLWLAETADQRRRGLMRVTSFGGYDGMLFRFEKASRGGFWMKNTVMPLSIAWVGSDGRVVTMLDMEPCPDGSDCPTYRPTDDYIWAIEVEQGRLDEFGFAPDSVVTLLTEPCERTSSAAP